MSDILGFAKWFTDKVNAQTSMHAKHDLLNKQVIASDAYEAGWQACQKINDARINTLNDAITEDKILESHNRDLLAANQVMREALQEVLTTIEDSDHWWMDEPGRGGFDADKIRLALQTKRNTE